MLKSKQNENAKDLKPSNDDDDIDDGNILDNNVEIIGYDNQDDMNELMLMSTKLLYICNLSYYNSNRDAQYKEKEKKYLDVLGITEYKIWDLKHHIDDTKINESIDNNHHSESNSNLDPNIEKANININNGEVMSQAISGYISYVNKQLKDTKIPFICFRGTVSFHDILADVLSIIPAPFISKKGTKIATTGAGIAATYHLIGEQGLQEYMIECIEKSSSIGILITGHSLGGALGNLLAAELITDYPELFQTKMIRLITFGAPRVFDQQYASIMDNCGLNPESIHNPYPLTQTSPTPTKSTPTATTTSSSSDDNNSDKNNVPNGLNSMMKQSFKNNTNATKNAAKTIASKIMNMSGLNNKSTAAKVTASILDDSVDDDDISNDDEYSSNNNNNNNDNSNNNNVSTTNNTINSNNTINKLMNNINTKNHYRIKHCNYKHYRFVNDNDIVTTLPPVELPFTNKSTMRIFDIVAGHCRLFHSGVAIFIPSNNSNSRKNMNISTNNSSNNNNSSSSSSSSSSTSSSNHMNTDTANSNSSNNKSNMNNINSSSSQGTNSVVTAHTTASATNTITTNTTSTTSASATNTAATKNKSTNDLFHSFLLSNNPFLSTTAANTTNTTTSYNTGSTSGLIQLQVIPSSEIFNFAPDPNQQDVWALLETLLIFVTSFGGIHKTDTCGGYLDRLYRSREFHSALQSINTDDSSSSSSSNNRNYCNSNSSNSNSNNNGNNTTSTDSNNNSILSAIKNSTVNNHDTSTATTAATTDEVSISSDVALKRSFDQLATLYDVPADEDSLTVGLRTGGMYLLAWLRRNWEINHYDDDDDGDDDNDDDDGLLIGNDNQAATTTTTTINNNKTSRTNNKSKIKNKNKNNKYSKHLQLRNKYLKYSLFGLLSMIFIYFTFNYCIECYSNRNNIINSNTTTVVIEPTIDKKSRSKSSSSGSSSSSSSSIVDNNDIKWDEFQMDINSPHRQYHDDDDDDDDDDSADVDKRQKRGRGRGRVVVVHIPIESLYIYLQAFVLHYNTTAVTNTNIYATANSVNDDDDDDNDDNDEDDINHDDRSNNSSNNNNNNSNNNINHENEHKRNMIVTNTTTPTITTTATTPTTRTDMTPTPTTPASARSLGSLVGSVEEFLQFIRTRTDVADIYSADSGGVRTCYSIGRYLYDSSSNNSNSNNSSNNNSNNGNGMKKKKKKKNSDSNSNTSNTTYDDKNINTSSSSSSSSLLSNPHDISNTNNTTTSSASASASATVNTLVLDSVTDAMARKLYAHTIDKYLDENVLLFLNGHHKQKFKEIHTLLSKEVVVEVVLNE